MSPLTTPDRPLMGSDPAPHPPTGDIAVPGRFTVLRGLAADIGLPLVGYYALHLCGASDWVALLAGTTAAAARLLWVAVRDRRITWFAVVMLAIYGLGLALAFIGGDARLFLLKESAGTAGVGLAFLGSLLARRPLTLSAFQSWRPDRAAEMETLYRTDRDARRGFDVSAVVWGLGLLAEAGLRIPLIYLLPLSVSVGLSTAMKVAAIVGLSVWNGIYVARVQARAAGSR